MVVMQLPKEVYDENVVVFVVGVLLGLLGYMLSSKINNQKQGLLVKLSSIVMVVITTLGLFGTVAFNVHRLQMDVDNINTYVENTTRDLGDRLTKTTTVQEFNLLIHDVYQAEYHVVERGFEITGGARTVGDTMLKGTGTEIGNYFTRLTEDERVMLMDTPRESLKAFTVMEFANMEHQIKRESLKLGSTGSMEVIEYIDTQQKGLENKISQLELPDSPIGKSFKNTIVINVAVAILSLGLTVMMYTMIMDTLGQVSTTKRKHLGMGDEHDVEEDTRGTVREDEETPNEKVEEYVLVDGDIRVEPDNEKVTTETNEEDTSDQVNREDNSYVEILHNKDDETLDNEWDEQLGGDITDKNKEPESKE